MCLPDTKTQTCNYRLPFTDHLLWSSGCWTTAAVTTVSPNRVTHLGWTSQSLVCLSWRRRNWSPVEYTQVFCIRSYFRVPIHLSWILLKTLCSIMVSRHYFWPRNLLFLVFMWLTGLTIYTMTEKYIVDRVTTHFAVPRVALIYICCSIIIIQSAPFALKMSFFKW